jgi:hypothetical protein
VAGVQWYPGERGGREVPLSTEGAAKSQSK